MKLWVYALLRAAARAGALPQRARAMCGARARRCIAAATLSAIFVAGPCVPPRARKLQRFCAVRGLLVSVVHLRELYMSADAGASSMRAAKAVNLSAEAATREW